jgi:hypothetical protein
MYLIHIHSQSSSGIDNYYIFDDYEEAFKFYKTYVVKNKDCISRDFFDVDDDEIFNIDKFRQSIIDNPPNYILFSDGDYCVLTQIYNGYGRRP